MCVVTAGVMTGLGVSAATAASAAAAANAAIIVAMTVATTTIQVLQAEEQTKAAEDQTDFEADKARFEGVIAARASKLEQVKNGIHARREFGKIQSQLAATGNDLGFGSTAKATQEVRRFQALDQELISQNAKTKAIGADLRVQGFQFQGKQARSALPFQTAGLALSGVARAGSSFTSALRAQQRFNLQTGSGTGARLDAFFSPHTVT